MKPQGEGASEEDTLGKPPPAFHSKVSTKDFDAASEERSGPEAMNITFGDTSGLFLNQVCFEIQEKTQETRVTD